MGSVPSFPAWRRAVQGPAGGSRPSRLPSQDPPGTLLPALPAPALGRNASSDLFTDDQTAWASRWPHSPWGFTSAHRGTPADRPGREPVSLVSSLQLHRRAESRAM